MNSFAYLVSGVLVRDAPSIPKSTYSRYPCYIQRTNDNVLTPLNQIMLSFTQINIAFQTLHEVEKKICKKVHSRLYIYTTTG